MKLAQALALVSWFIGGILLGLIEVISLPTDPKYSTLLQLLPLFFLLGGIWFVAKQFQNISSVDSSMARRLRTAMIIGWFALFGIDAGVASVYNMSSQVFHLQLPYYYQGISLGQRIIALSGIFLLGGTATVAARSGRTVKRNERISSDFWEKPVTNIGFSSLLLGVVLGLASYWSPVVFAGFVLLLAGTFLLPIGVLTEKQICHF